MGTKRGASTALRLACDRFTWSFDPFIQYHGRVIATWATGIWLNQPKAAILQQVLEAALTKLDGTANKWASLTDPAEVYAMACFTLGWRPLSAKQVRTLDGHTIDLQRLAPKTVAQLAMKDARAVSDATCYASFPWQGPIFWEPVHALVQKSSDGWTSHHKACLRSSVSGCLWDVQQGFRSGLWRWPRLLALRRQGLPIPPAI